MADLEKREDQKIRECLQQAYGYSDEQLLKKMEEAEKSLEDTDFPGAEERIFQKLMERKAAEEEKEERAGKPAQLPEPAPSGASVSGGAAPKRFGKRKLAISAALAAAFAVLLGITAIGGRSYFFRARRDKLNAVIINNNPNKKDVSQLEEAYQLIEAELGIPVLRLDYVPTNLDFQTSVQKENSVTIQFLYNGNIIILYEGKEADNISVGIESDRYQSKTVYNEWLDQEIAYLKNELEDGRTEYETLLTIDENIYYFSGIMPEEEFVKIIKFFSLKVS